MDVIRALMGRKYCDWCITRDPSWWDRLMRFDQFLGTASRPWWERAAIAWGNLWTKKLPLWKFGMHWHIKHHDG